jgi:hypothetical protein
MISPFNFSTTPLLHFGVGKISVLSTLANNFGSRALVITGRQSFNAFNGMRILEQFKGSKLDRFNIESEPTPLSLILQQAVFHQANQMLSLLSVVVVYWMRERLSPGCFP